MATLVVVAQHHLGNHEADQFTVGKVRAVSAAGARWDDVVIDQDVECS